MELEKWQIFNLVDKEFIKELTKVFVFGNAGNEVFMFTKSDDVYAIGFNASGCLGIGDQISKLTPTKVDVLCQKNIKGLAAGFGPHVLACTENGELYTWGHNGYCQLGNGSNAMVMTPTLTLENLHQKKVLRVAAGSHHSLVLTTDGEVYAWGQNNHGQIGSGTTTNQSSPRKVMANVGGRAVSDIACCQASSFAVMDNGEVYSWGLNANGQLGLASTVNQHNTSRVTALQGVVITKIVCGVSHCIVLTDEGHLYSWGANSFGQLGTGNKANQTSPTRIALEIERIVDIASSTYCYITGAMAQNSKIYIWGSCKGLSICKPLETPLNSLHEIFALWASPNVTHKPIIIHNCSPISLKHCLADALDDQETSDIVFILEGKKIHAHRAILKITCQYFRKMFQSHWKENQSEEVVIKEFTYTVFYAFLQFLYTGDLSASPEDAVGVLDLATAYCEDSLKLYSERIIRRGISIENAAMLYAIAIKYETVELEEFCFHFALNHMTEVAQTDAFMALDELTVKNFIHKAAQHGAFKY